MSDIPAADRSVNVPADSLRHGKLATDSAQAYAENVISTVREPLVVLDPELRVESVNRAFYDTFGGTPADTIGRFLYDLGNHQWDIPELRGLLEEILPQNRTIEDFMVERDFEHVGPRSMLLNARRMHGPGAIHSRIVLAIEDVTERKQTEERLRDSEERYRTLFDLGPVAVYTCDAAGVLQKFNHRASELWGREPELGDTHHRFCGSYKLYRPDGRFMPHEECPMAEVVAGALTEVRDAEVLIERPDGSRVTVVVNIRPLKDQRGEVNGAINCFYDITERKRAEEATRESERHKSEFLAMLAHELRNPLAPILVSIEVLRRAKSIEWLHQGVGGRPDESSATTEDRPRVDHALDVLRRQVGHMVRLVDDLLDAGRLSLGKIDLRKEQVELSSVVYHVVEAVRPISEGRDQELTVTLPYAPVYLEADPTRLAQLVGNILNNASKFTPRGGHIWLSVERDAAAPAASTDASLRSTEHVVIRVRDTGIGIAAEQLEHVFEMFTQADTSLERSVTGLGIGLTLVKTLTEMHGGTVAVSSNGLGRGSEFVVRLPIVDADTRSIRPTATASVATTPLRILIVDDNRDAVDMLSMLLTSSGHKTFAVHDGLAAVKAATTLDPDVVLLDIGLPGLNGYEAARRIREQHSQKGRPLLVALTGWGQVEDRRRSEEAGFDAHMVKPVDNVVLGKLLAAFGADRDSLRNRPGDDTGVKRERLSEPS